VITYHKGQGPIFSTHPIEKPYCTSVEELLLTSVIFQIGSSNPELAVKAAQTVAADVSGMQVTLMARVTIR
jgi:tRNA-dihydrouridine synthase 2